MGRKTSMEVHGPNWRRTESSTGDMKTTFMRHSWPTSSAVRCVKAKEREDNRNKGLGAVCGQKHPGVSARGGSLEHLVNM